MLFQGFTIESIDQARILRQYCERVLVEGEEKVLSVALDKVMLHRQRTSVPMSETRPLANEIPRAREAWSKTQAFVEQVTRDIEQGNDLNLQEWQISHFARLVSIVDAFDAMTSDRCYRDGIPASDAIRILYQNRGRQFDADMVEAFILHNRANSGDTLFSE